ncbi:glucose-1-phosphate thymidylyltransferase RfbA [Gammaproteobacteria bacterium]|nr:glucose-1-phosphate thymidylyltransferase RfbA [Gammaproteobacteria bacterium]
MLTMEKNRKGIILAGGSGTRLYPLTKVVSKQLMPVYDKPMIYYPLSTLMEASIRDILIISTPAEILRFEDLLGDGSKFGVNLSYCIQKTPDGIAQSFILGSKFIGTSDVALILGDNLFYGADFNKILKTANNNPGCTIFGYHVSNPKDYGVIHLDKNNQPLSIEEKPDSPKSNYAIPGLYFFNSSVVEIAKSLSPSKRGELEITDVIDYYLQSNELHVEKLGRGTAWLDTGTHNDLLAAAQFIETIEKRQGLKINCPEEVAYKNGWLSSQELIEISKPLLKSGYGKYLLNLIQDK